MEEILDVDNHPFRKYRKRIGFSFNLIQRLVSWFLFLSSLLVIFGAPWLGIPLTLLFLYGATGSYGMQIQADKDRFREYQSLAGIRWGKWKSLKEYPDVAILTENKGYAVYSQSNRRTADTDLSYGVYLLTPSHRVRVEVSTFKEKQEAKKFAEELAMVLLKKYTVYNPQVSQKTRSRRR